jgi:hypothetical protein
MDFIDGARRGATKFLRIHFFAGRRCPNQMMPDLRERCRVGLCGQKIEATINLKRIRADNFGAEVVRDISRQLRFPGSGRTDDEKRARYMTHETYRPHKKSGDVLLEAASPDRIIGTR